MRRWNPLFLVAPLSLVALLAPTLVTPNRAMAATPTPTSFKGKAAVYYRSSPAYFVVSFTCAPPVPGATSTLSGNWTWVTSSAVSYSGTLAFSGCALTQNMDGSWSSSMDKITLSPQKSNTTATLNLTLSNISGTKTYVLNTTNCSGTTNHCIVITTSGLGAAVVPQDDNDDFTSLPAANLLNDVAPYGTLNLTLP